MNGDGILHNIPRLVVRNALILFENDLFTYFLFLGAPKSLQMVTAAMKLKKRLLLGRKVMTNLDSILKSRDITLPTKVCLVKAMVFPVVHVWV